MTTIHSQIFEGMNSLSSLRVSDLANIVLLIGQYPVGSVSTLSVFEWVMLLFKKAQSGEAGLLTLFSG